MREEVNYKKLCVRSYKDVFIYPKSIPRERGPLANTISIIIFVILFVVSTFMDKNPLKITFIQYCAGIIFLIIFQLIYRTILICEEYNHLISRYEGSIITLIKDTYTFHLSITKWTIIAVSTTVVVWHFSSTGFVFGTMDSFKLMLFSLNMYIIHQILSLDAGHLDDSLWVAKNNGLDYGSGMAYSFFHGYLNLILPKTGREDKHLREIMQDYEDKHDVNFAVYKLFILIPKSMRCFVSLQNEYSRSIEESTSLDEKVLTVAGVQNRVYKNAVYKIVSEQYRSKPIYVSAEYATPLKTFKDVFDNTGQHSDFYNKHKKDIILQFYLTLEKLLEHRGLNEYCELIYYEDSYQKDGVTHYYDVGHIIQERLTELKNRKLN